MFLGDLKITLTSPSGTESLLAEPHASIPVLFLDNNEAATIKIGLYHK